MNYLPCVEVQSNPKIDVNAAVIWLHGLGSDGHDFAPIVPELKLPPTLNVRFIFPHAPSIPVTVNSGYIMPAWYDIIELTLDRRVDVQQLRASAAQVHALVEREIERGVPSDKIVIAGFSQGGAVAYEAALSYAKPLAGLLALSTYFATHDSVVINDANKDISVLIQHGTEDGVVPELLGQRAARQLEVFGIVAEYEIYPMEHTVCAAQVADISEWLQKRLQ
jgi:phospholipase/carboxylesterase